MQATNNALAEETSCAKDGDDRCDHSVPDIVKLLLGTREDRDRSSGSDDRAHTLVAEISCKTLETASGAPATSDPSQVGLPAAPAPTHFGVQLFG